MKNTVHFAAVLSLLAFAAIEVHAQAEVPLADYEEGVIVGDVDYFDYAGDYDTPILIPGLAPVTSVPEPSVDVPTLAPEPEAEVPTGEEPPVESPSPSPMPSPMPSPCPRHPQSLCLCHLQHLPLRQSHCHHQSLCLCHLQHHQAVQLI
eukprot:jgi/Picre1/28694/NNA_004094.t1